MTLFYETNVKGKVKGQVKNLQVLFDSGGLANLIQKRHIGQNFKLLNSKGPVTWETTNGKFWTNKIMVPEFQLVTIKQPFHVYDYDLGYDTIIGRETLAELGFIINKADGLRPTPCRLRLTILLNEFHMKQI